VTAEGPQRAAAARPGRMHLAPPVSQDHRPALPDRLRPTADMSAQQSQPSRAGVPALWPDAKILARMPHTRATCWT
jgi:hypothetical protein